MNKIDNEFYDLLDYAADVSDEFDMKNNTREYLLKHFELEEGKDALSKAENNVRIFEKLREMEEEWN